MASTSTPQDVQRANARLQQDPRPVSFFGKVKSYITAPFSWLMGTNEDTNDYEERDGAGKRKRSSMAPLESTEEEEVQYLGTKRAPIKRVRYQTDRVSLSLRQEPLSVSHSASTLTRYVSTSAQPSASTSNQPSASISAQPSVSTSAYEERDGHREHQRTATTPVEIEEEEEEEIQYLGRKSPELGRSIRENGLRFTSEALEKLPGPESLAIHKPTDRYSVCFGPVLPPVGIVRLFVRVFLRVFLTSIDCRLG